MKMVDFSSDRY